MTTTVLTNVRRIGTRGALADMVASEGRITTIAPAGVVDAVPSATVVDAEGAWVGPGLWDHHTHFDQWALVRRRPDVSACAGPDEVVTMLRAHLRADARPDVLVAAGYRDGLWREPAHRDVLDGVSPALPGEPIVPVVVISADLHAVWCNGAALDHLSGVLGRDWRDHPTGVLREQDAFDVTQALARVPDAQLDAWVGDAVEAAAARGVVGIVDLEMAFGLDRWHRRIAAGTDGLRVRSGVYPWELDAVITRGLRTGDVVPGAHGLLTMGPFKIITDGSLGTRTAAVVDAYAGLSGDGDHGVFAFGRDEVRTLVRRAVDAGLVPAVHAIGDAANARALDVFEEVGATGTIEHAQLLRPEDVERFARLGVAASVQPEHAMDDRDIADRYWAGRNDRAFAFASLARAGVRLLFGSDAPVAPLDPWIAMAAAVGRDRDGRGPWHAEQRVTPLVAWRASTDGRSTIAVGDIADLVLVDRDPLAADAASLRETRVLGTAVDGRWTYRA